MAPYIAALIILIVAILFAVYKRVDGFEINTSSLKPTDTIQTAITVTQALLSDNAEIVKILDSIPEIKDELTEATLDKLMLPFSRVDGKVKLSGPSVTVVLKESSKGLENEMKPFLEGASKLNPSMKLNELITNPSDLQNFISGVEILKTLIKNRKDFVKTKGAFTTVGGVKSEDLYDAVSGSNAAVKASTVDNSGNELLTGAAPATTPQFTKEIEERIAKSVATQVKDMMLSQRSTSNGTEDAGCPYAPYESNSTAQGKEYTQAKPIQPAPDMSEYIRKDSIPCWNCSLPN